MNSADFDQLDEADKKHFYRCGQRGEMVDMRQLDDVLFHEAGWSWGCVSAVDSCRRAIWIADAHRDDGKRLVARSEEKLTAFVELESATCAHGRFS